MVARKVPATPASENNGCVWAAVIGIIAVVVLAIGQCSSSDQGANSLVTDAMNETDLSMSNAIAAQTPPPPEPLHASNVTRGVTHLRLAVAAEGFPGAMIYSQNCYDALAHQFSWAKLDACGAFDMLAVRSIENADTNALTSEPTYFESEFAARRYLAAATSAGESPSAADARLSRLQSRASQARSVSGPAAQAEETVPDISSAEANSQQLVNDLMAEPLDLEAAE